MKTLAVPAIFLILFSLVTTVAQHSCQECEAGPSDPSTFSFCGSDGKSHRIPQGDRYSSECFLRCGVLFKHAGTCECPNGCYNSTDNGNCTPQGCECKPGYGGLDCSAIQCESANQCQYGQCLMDSTNSSYCKCSPGWTSADCSIPVAADFGGSLPYGIFFPHDRPYWIKDEYRDDHPMLNLSVIANIRLEVSESDWSSLLNPINLWNASRIIGSAIFDNGNVRIHAPMGIKLKGSSTRSTFGRGYDLKFSDKIMGLQGLDLKGFDPAFLRNLLCADVYRSCNIPTPRSSFVTLWVNKIQMGTFWMSEHVDKHFLKKRYQDSTGSLIKGSTWITDRGENPENYENATYDFHGMKFPYFEMSSGENWTKFAQISHGKQMSPWLPNSPTFQVEKSTRFQLENSTWMVDQDRLMRLLAGDVITTNSDCLVMTGNNWFLYYNPETNEFELFQHDFDLSFNLNMVSMAPKKYSHLEIFNLNPENFQLLQKYVDFLAGKILDSEIQVENYRLKNSR